MVAIYFQNYIWWSHKSSNMAAVTINRTEGITATEQIKPHFYTKMTWNVYSSLIYDASFVKQSILPILAQKKLFDNL